MRIAVLPALGIGDALLMMIASHQLQKPGYDVVTFHNAISELQEWFPRQQLQREEPISSLFFCDWIFVENDNSPKIRALIEARDEEKIRRLTVFYPTYNPTKHAPLHPDDRVFDASCTMVENIAASIADLLGQPLCTQNGITPPPISRNQKHSVLIHPTSREAKKNWSPDRYLAFAKRLKASGMSPLFCVSPQERNEWEWVQSHDIDLVTPSNLAELATVIYQSTYVIGNDSLTGHLASNLGIPTLIIANDPDHMSLWRPGWFPGVVLCPPSWLPKGRFRNTHWQKFISPRKAHHTFKTMI